jgi:hypothetical protein
MCLNETYSKVCIGKLLSATFPIQNGLKQEDALPSLFFIFVLKYTIRKVQENQVGLKLSGTCQLLSHADNINLLGDNLNTTKKNAETVIDASKKGGLEVNTEKGESVFVFCHQNPGQDHKTKLAIRSFVNVTEFRYLGIKVKR